MANGFLCLAAAENISGPSTCSFYGSDAASPPDDVKQKFVVSSF